ncbi:MAG TPA: DUF559 domain-containing protein [Rhodoblastus sp.]|nr:DUF559 domain-containing protein [Rhodoblastus sp.]
MSAAHRFARRLLRASSNAEAALWRALRAHRLAGLQFRRQAPCGAFIADFLCHAAPLVIEIDGATHSTDAELGRDRRRDVWFVANGWRVLWFRNDEVYNNFDGAIETILAHLPQAAEVPQAPSPTLPRCAGEGEDSSLHPESWSRTPAVPSLAATKSAVADFDQIRGREREGVAPHRKSDVPS